MRCRHENYRIRCYNLFGISVSVRHMRTLISRCYLQRYSRVQNNYFVFVRNNHFVRTCFTSSRTLTFCGRLRILIRRELLISWLKYKLIAILRVLVAVLIRTRRRFVIRRADSDGRVERNGIIISDILSKSQKRFATNLSRVEYIFEW